MNTWILQKNFSEQSLIDCLDRLGVPYVFAKPIPFSEGELVEEIEVNGPVIVHGTTSLIKAAIKRGWTPGALLNEDTFVPEVWVQKHGEKMLNHDSLTISLSEPMPLGREMAFVRPCDDFKGFTGQVFDRALYDEFRRNFHDKSQKIMISSPKQVETEWRLFIVDGKYITGSRYRPFFEDFVPKDVIDFAEELISYWGPATSYAMDICDVTGQLKVVEYNCINGAGYYKADLQKIVEALSFCKG